MTSAESRLDGIAHFDVHITDKNIDTSVKTLISHIKKSWDITKLRKKIFDDGITNKLIGFYVDNGDLKVSTQFGEFGRSDIVLVRIYGVKTELIIDRAQELRNFQELSRCNLAPALYCTFANGYCYKFVEGKVLGASDFQEKSILEHCSKYMAELHSVNLSAEYLNHHPMESNCFQKIQRSTNLIPKEYNSAAKQKFFLEKLPSGEKLHQEIAVISEAISKLNYKKIVFCHNDLLCANFIFDVNQDKMFTIDYEYGAPNYAAYDIANHFNEFAGIDNVDYNLYPDKPTQLEWLRNYLVQVNEARGVHEEVTESNVEELFIAVSVFTLASHLFWGIWALVQAHYSQIDFDYMGYSLIRLDEYFTKKDERLALARQQ